MDTRRVYGRCQATTRRASCVFAPCGVVVKEDEMPGARGRVGSIVCTILEYPWDKRTATTCARVTTTPLTMDICVPRLLEIRPSFPRTPGA